MKAKGQKANEAIRLGVVGFGRIGKACAEVLLESKDLVLAGIVRRAAIWNQFLAMVGPDSAPTVTITRSGNQVTLSWSASAAGYILHSTDNLGAPSWTPVPGVVGTSVTVNASTGNRFYRLIK